MYTTIEDFMIFLRNALEQTYNTSIRCEQYSQIIKLMDNIVDTEALENDIIISNPEDQQEIRNDSDYEASEEIFYSECHFIDEKEKNRICVILYTFPIIDNQYSAITDCYQILFYINYFIDSLNCCEKLGILADIINKSLLDVTNNRTGRISESDYNQVLKKIDNNKKLFLKRMS